MEIQSVLLLLGIILLVGAFIARPLTRQSRHVSEKDHERSALLAERERLLAALRELDFDLSLGKVPEEDYPIQRADLLRLGADVIRQLDTISTGAKEVVATPLTANIDITDDQIEELISKRRSIRKVPTSGFCPKCGKAVLLSDRFCPSCGEKLK